MRTIFIVVLTLFALMVGALTGGQGPISSAEDGCTAEGCHAELSNADFLHAPIPDGCEGCHEQTGEGHPEDDGAEFALTEQLPDLCNMCHEAYDNGGIHAPVSDGDCTTCHNPHGSSTKALLTEQDIGTLCRNCHEIMEEDPVAVHAPAGDGDCMSCHTAHQSDAGALLAKEPPELCADCHPDYEDNTALEYVHAVYDDCMGCHVAHSSRTKHLLTDTLPELCETCHGDIAESLVNARIVHEPVNSEESCVSCHSAHASTEESLLMKPAKVLCMGCHTARRTKRAKERSLDNTEPMIEQFNMEFVHAPMEYEGCASCHKAHGSEYARLLTSAYPGGTYAYGSSADYGLCYQCHDSDMMAEGAETAFRSAERNYHTLHVAREKSIVCTVCHAVHTSTNEEMVRTETAFGHWPMPIKFSKTEDSGSCAPGCHPPSPYGIASTPDAE